MTTEDPIFIKFLENKNRRATRSVSAEKDNANRIISQIVTGFQNTSLHKYVLVEGVICFPNNGSRTKVSDANISSASKIRNEP